MKRLVLLSCLLGFSPFSQATFGLGPCCSGAVCGIIPCDNECAGAALTTWGSDMSSGLNTTQSHLEDLTVETNTLNDNIATHYSNVSSAYTSYFTSMFSGLDVLTNKIEFSITLTQKGLEALAESVNAAFHEAFSAQTLFAEISKNDGLYGEHSKTYTGAILLNSISERNELEVNSQDSAYQISQTLQEVEGLKEESALYNWANSFNEKTNLSDDLLAQQMLANITNDDVYLIATKLANTHNEQSNILPFWGVIDSLSSGVLLKETTEDTLTSDSTEFSLLGLTSIDAMNGISSSNHTGLLREYTVLNQLKSQRLRMFLSMKTAQQVGDAATTYDE
ncbi:MAG: hypothetical protein JXQ95_07155 [Alteromonas stellipolaris]|uniref:hypothetical protein n=1 Tax=Alteromonas stellipolaris TaxID=233316 RepID=UPI003B8BB80B